MLPKMLMRLTKFLSLVTSRTDILVPETFHPTDLLREPPEGRFPLHFLDTHCTVVKRKKLLESDRAQSSPKKNLGNIKAAVGFG